MSINDEKLECLSYMSSCCMFEAFSLVLLLLLWMSLLLSLFLQFERKERFAETKQDAESQFVLEISVLSVIVKRVISHVEVKVPDVFKLKREDNVVCLMVGSVTVCVTVDCDKTICF